MILFIDGMAHYATDQIDKKYTSVTASGAAWSIAAEGRYRNALKRVASAGHTGGEVTVAPLMTQSGVWVPTSSGVWGAAIKVNPLTSVSQFNLGGFGGIFTLTEGDFPVMSVSLNPNGTFTAWRSGNGAFGVRQIAMATSVQGIRSNVWAYVEIKWNISQTVGYVQVCANEVPILSYGITPERNGTPTGGYVWGSSVAWAYLGTWTAATWGNIGGASPYPTLWMGDIYLADQEGGAEEVNDYVGDNTIDVIVPDGVGNVTGWAPVSGVNWDNVEEIPPDDGLTYISATTVGTRDSYTFQDVPPGTEPVCYQQLIYTRKDTPGASTLSPTMRVGGTTYDATPQGVSTSDEYRYIIQPYDTNPATGARITESEINAAEFGVVKVG